MCLNSQIEKLKTHCEQKKVINKFTFSLKGLGVSKLIFYHPSQNLKSIESNK